jgi:uncharacterized DUF497 family protein
VNAGELSNAARGAHRTCRSLNLCIYKGVFAWDANKAGLNLSKHGVPFDEAATVFGDDQGLEWEDLQHSDKEARLKRLGRSNMGRILLVVYTVKRSIDGKETIRIISARQASRKERKAYAR